MSRKQINVYKDQMTAAETEPMRAKMRVKVPSSVDGKAMANVEAQRKNIETRMESSVPTEGITESSDYEEMMREVGVVKNEVRELMSNIASVLEQRSRAEREIERVRLEIQKNLKAAESLRHEVDISNEELILVELARIEAQKELGEIEAQREKSASEYLAMIEERKSKIKEMVEEIEESKKFENKLSETLSDVNMLETQLKLVKEMERRVKRNDSLGRSNSNFSYGEELECSRMMTMAQNELGSKNNELNSIKQEGFFLMTSMDTLRQELSRVKEQIAQLSRAGEKTEIKIQNLNSKILRAKSKLETVSAAEEKARSMAANLCVTLEQLKKDAESAKNEKKVIQDDIECTKAKTRETEREIDLGEERLMATLDELEEAKASEALALEKLESLIKNTVKGRASAAERSSTITVSKFEYEYLVGHAVWAKEIADKKIEAAQAWINALKASEKEILLRVESTKRKNKETKPEEEKEVDMTQRDLSAKRMVEKELTRFGLEHEMPREAKNSSPTVRKSTKGNPKFAPTPHSKFRSSYSPGTAVAPPTTCFVIKKKRVVPRLVKLFGAKR